MTSVYRRTGRKGWTLEWRDAAGRTRQRSFRTKALADAQGAKVRGEAGLAADQPFATYAAAWLRATRTAVRVGSFKRYRWALHRHVAPAFEGLTLREVTHERVRAFLVGLAESKLARNTVASIRATLHAVLEMAVDDQVLPTNPARFRQRTRLARALTTGDAHVGVMAMDTAQVRRFFETSFHVAPRHHVIFRTMVSTGLRPGEALALRPEDLEYGAQRIRVARAVTHGRLEPAKTAKAGTFEYVDMPPGLAAELQAWERQTAQDALAAGRPRVYLFPTPEGRPGAYETLRKAFARVVRAAGLPAHLRPHSLRHTFATQHLIAGTGVYYVSRQLRHADIRLTVRRYGSWLPAADQGAAARLEERLFAGSHCQRIVRNL